MQTNMCFNCANFYRHYTVSKYRVSPLNFGHCKYKKEVFRVCDESSTCKNFYLRDAQKAKEQQVSIMLKDMQKVYRELNKLLIHLNIINTEDFGN